MDVLVEFRCSESHILPVFCGCDPDSQIQTPQGYLFTFREQRLPHCTLIVAVLRSCSCGSPLHS